MRSGRRGLLLLLVLGFLVPTPAAGARQLDASDYPKTSGPLSLETRECGRRKTRSQSGEVVAVATSCLYFYSFDASKEGSVNRDFGVIWLQTNVNARPGWCTTSISSEIDVPGRARLHSHKPALKEASSKRRVFTGLRLNARDSAVKAASIGRRFVLYARRMRGLVRADRRIFRTVWYGRSSRRLATVSGIEVSWRAAGGPPESLSSRLGYDVERGTSC
jgi:hypothetical protein